MDAKNRNEALASTERNGWDLGSGMYVENFEYVKQLVFVVISVEMVVFLKQWLLISNRWHHTFRILKVCIQPFLSRDTLNLETAVGSQKSARALSAPGKIQKCLITTEVTTTFCISPCTPIAYTSFLRPTAVSRVKNCLCCHYAKT